MDQGTVDVYELLNREIEKAEYIQPSVKSVVLKKIKAWLRSNYQNIIIVLLHMLSLYFLILMVSRICWALYYLDDGMLLDIPTGIVIGIIIPSFNWLYSTCYDYWNYKTSKIFGLLVATFNAFIVLETLLLRAALSLLLPLILNIPISQDITENMVIMLARIIVSLVLVLGGAGFYAIIFRNIFDKRSMSMIMYYKLNRGWDTRSKKAYCYDMDIVRYLSTGKMHKIYEEDRFLHCMSVGTTGTGKTSTCLTVTINNDLDRRVKNEDWLKRKLSRMLKKGQVRMTRDFDDIDFSAKYFEVTDKKYDKKFKKIVEKAMSVGITAMAPNEKFSDELYALAKAKQIKVNRIDPNLDSNGKHKEGFIGFNPLYISPNLKGVERKLEIFSKARVFADVNQAIFEKDENGDIYFTGLNRNFTTSITVMVLLTYPSLYNGRQPTPNVVQDIINNFSKAQKYRDEMVRLYSTKFNQMNNPVMDIGKAEVGEYQFILDVIDKDILGKGAQQMEDQARGLRNIINETLSNPLIRDVLCAENTIDIDEALDKGEVTFINFAINLGSAGTAFGMFYLLSFINAVLRRPAGKKLIPHFCSIDELPEILHPELGRAFALFRQYKTGMFVALQSLDQMDKSPKTKYLKNVIVGGCAHQIIFGRCSTAEMKLYQELSGYRYDIEEMNGISETALSMENTSMTMTTRETSKQVSNIEGGDMRYRDFREVTMFTVVKGSPIKPFFGKTFFLEDIKKIEKIRYVFNWSKYFVPSEGFKEETKSISASSTKQSSTGISEYTRKLNTINEAKTAPVEVTQQSVTTVETKEEHIDDAPAPYSMIIISSGKDLIEEGKIQANNQEEQIVDEEMPITDGFYEPSFEIGFDEGGE